MHKSKKIQLKVFHTPINWAGFPQIVSETLREMGARSFLLTINHEGNYLSDKNIIMTGGIRGNIQFIIEFAKSLFLYDIFHFWGRGLIYPRLSEPKRIFERFFKSWHLPLLKLLRKRIFFWFLGGDVNIKEICMKRGPACPCSVCEYYETCNSEIRKKTLEIANQYADGLIVGHDPNHLRQVPREKRHYLELPFKLPKIDEISQIRQNNSVRVLHAPTARLVKGTPHVLSAIEKLERKGVEFEFVLVEGQPHERVLEEIRKSDIVLDQFLQGGYGVFALEAMSMGKPVLGFVTDAKKIHPDLPIINTSPEEIASNLEVLINNPQKRESIGRESRRYVKRNHDPRMIFKRLIRIYLGLDKPKGRK